MVRRLTLRCRAEENFLHLNPDHLQCGAFLDMGANHGACAALPAKIAPTASIFAFEPHLTTFTCLRSRMAGFPAVQAVVDRKGKLKLYNVRSEDGSAQRRLGETAVGLYSAGIGEHAVDCTTVDAFMDETGLNHIDLLKFDAK